MKNLITIALFFVFVMPCTAQIPNGYYNNALGIAGGTPLLIALRNIIDNHKSVPYSDVELSYPLTDKKPNGKVWDMYSYKFTGAQPYEFTFVTNQCGNYAKEGDCFNKEHIWPQSMFNQDTPTRSDLHHLPPTDGWVNNKRANFPYGIVLSSPSPYISANGSKMGATSSYTGYSGNAFEPIDSFKGDIARSIMYISCRYNASSSGWQNWPMANKTTLTADAITLLLNWHHFDPVSKKEIDRNNAIYGIQKNRNPFIDEPLFADCIWGNIDCSNLAVSIKDINLKQLQTIVANNILTVQNFNGDLNKINIFNLTGQLVANSNKNHLDIANLPEGIYIVSCQVNKDIIYRKIFK